MFSCLFYYTCTKCSKFSIPAISLRWDLLKRFPVDSNQMRCHGNAFIKKHLAKIVRILEEMVFFSAKIVFISDFLDQIEISALKLTQVQNFSQFK